MLHAFLIERLRRRAVEVAHPLDGDEATPSKPARLPEVKKVIDAMQNSPTAAYLVNCSRHEKTMLASLLKCIRRTGLETVKWGEVSSSKKPEGLN